MMWFATFFAFHGKGYFQQRHDINELSFLLEDLVTEFKSNKASERTDI
jgi:hypothetical protein